MSGDKLCQLAQAFPFSSMESTASQLITQSQANGDGWSPRQHEAECAKGQNVSCSLIRRANQLGLVVREGFLGKG